jgi:hypothetical protein
MKKFPHNPGCFYRFNNVEGPSCVCTDYNACADDGPEIDVIRFFGMHPKGIHKKFRDGSFLLRNLLCALN